MAHFAEIDENNKVLRVVVGCNQEVNSHGGDQSEEAALDFGNRVPLSKNGVKWVQTSYNRNFRKNYAGVGFTYDSNRDAFIAPKLHNSWVFNESKCIWEAPIAFPTDEKYMPFVNWDESNQRWVAYDYSTDPFKLVIWNSSTLVWEIQN
jgi:hypothetical protein